MCGTFRNTKTKSTFFTRLIHGKHSCKIESLILGSQINRTAGWVLVLYTTDSGLITSILYGHLSLSGIISERRVRRNS